jgi:GNAT superfamily N-acetyltransferase
MSDATGDNRALPLTLPSGIVIRRATEADAEAIASVVRAAFTTVAEEIGFDIPPVHETAAEVLPVFSAGDMALLAERDGRAVGTVRADTLEDGSIMVRRLAVLPDARRTGLARALMTALEDAYPAATRFELFTGADAAVPIALYESLGYTMFEPAEVMSFPLVYLEKCR